MSTLLAADRPHYIALKMIDHLLELRGFKVLFSGQDTSPVKIEQLFENFAPKRLYISSTYILNRPRAQSALEQICHLCKKYTVDLYIGGQGFNTLKYTQLENVMRLRNFTEVFQA